MTNKEFLLFTIKFLLIYSCATQVPPSGGPLDKTQPRIINVIPENKATLVPLDQRIEFEFSEGMNHKSSERAVFISPDPGDRVKIKWKGRKLRIEFSDSLKTNRTYVITLGTDLKDAHNNGLPQSVTLAFSTGEEISDGKINGRVFTEEQARGILIWAYILGAGSEPNPSQKSGDYITQTDAQGKFELSNLSEGLYRIFAIRDTDRNRFYESGLDGIGVTHKDVLLQGDSLTVSNINFRIAMKDTVGPALISASTLNQTGLKLIFDEALTRDGVGDLSNYKIRAAKSSDTLAVRLAFLNEFDQKEVVLLTGPQSSQTEYEIRINNLKDPSQNLIDPKFNLGHFVGSALPDTFRPKIVSVAPRDSARSIFLNTTIDFYFDEPMNQESFAQSFFLLDSSGQTVPGAFDWTSPASVKFKPAGSFKSLASYRATVKLDSVFDLAGNAIADSTFQLVFTTLNSDTLSVLSGTVVDKDSTGQGRIFLKAGQNVTGGQTYEIQLDEPGPYEFNNILPGIYSIDGFRDRDNNGKYSFGQAFPFKPAERFVVYPDTIKIRARWPNEGNDIVFSK